MKYLVLFASFLSFAQTKQFIPLDNETLEYISDVNYTLYSNNKSVYSNISSKDSVTPLPNNIHFDSIAFSKFNYNKTGLRKENLTELVLLSKKVFELDEVVVSNAAPTEILIGEESRFQKRNSKPLSKNQNYGILFRKNELKDIQLNKLAFFVEKVKYKTIYKVKFYTATETFEVISRQFLEINELLFESPILTLDKGMKNKIEVDLKTYNMNTNNKNIFVQLELINYHDDNNTVIHPSIKDQTRLKFQQSSKANYFSKMGDIITKKMVTDLININAMINYDFAMVFHKTPHKSTLVTPAILLYGDKMDDNPNN